MKFFEINFNFVSTLSRTQNPETGINILILVSRALLGPLKKAFFMSFLS
jgi:hypothetical protein